jgi:hypothetical protein
MLDHDLHISALQLWAHPREVANAIASERLIHCNPSRLAAGSRQRPWPTASGFCSAADPALSLVVIARAHPTASSSSRVSSRVLLRRRCGTLGETAASSAETGTGASAHVAMSMRRNPGQAVTKAASGRVAGRAGAVPTRRQGITAGARKSGCSVSRSSECSTRLPVAATRGDVPPGEIG